MSALEVRRAIWTPWAEVLCADCNNAASFTAQRISNARIIEPSTVSIDWHRAFPCDVCGQSIGFEGCGSVADLCELREQLRFMGFDPQLQQTGGMCAALVEYWNDGQFAIVATNMDEHDGEFVMGVYHCSDPGEWGCGVDDEPLHDWNWQPGNFAVSMYQWREQFGITFEVKS